MCALGETISHLEARAQTLDMRSMRQSLAIERAEFRAHSAPPFKPVLAISNLDDGFLSQVRLLAEIVTEIWVRFAKRHNYYLKFPTPHQF